ncbi:glycosyltransferase family 2 protein [Pedobacter chinensis]|uniref:Glycosyltransferase family 2 protein n=1 Tax=Pedobacter chinensis TaxID=2282421 RepID=A0A369PU60_9SPHI|nr:glycosyltransferase family 2 protein [Pedobacter chinensis]RDC54259.1 glycosyltransferase family 2 protein [Pedobacter chinensis]
MGIKLIILMATYNGAKYLRQQLDSIKLQTYRDWELYIRDDQSTDETPVILQSYAAKDKRIKLLDIAGPHGSPGLNFSVLFNYVSTKKNDYIMFADQDDVWNLDKIAVSLSFIQALEQKEANDLPLLVYSNFQFVDEKTSVLHQELPMPSELIMPVLLTANYAYGCTMMLNQALVNKIKVIPETAEFHDYWISLVACVFGKAVLLPQKLLKYRQHNRNASTNVYSRSIASRFRRYIYRPADRLPFLTRQHKMIGVFFKTYQNDLTQAMSFLIKEYLKAFNQSNVALLSFMLRKKLRMVGLLQTFAHFYIVIYLRKKIISV